MISSHEDLHVWVKARSLTIDIYAEFKSCKDFAFKDQIQRASVSVMNNIAEGYARHSNKSFRHFLLIARGSASEVESMVILADELNYIDKIRTDQLMHKTDRIMRLLTNFAKKLAD